MSAFYSKIQWGVSFIVGIMIASYRGDLTIQEEQVLLGCSKQAIIIIQQICPQSWISQTQKALEIYNPTSHFTDRTTEGPGETQTSGPETH